AEPAAALVPARLRAPSTNKPRLYVQRQSLITNHFNLAQESQQKHPCATAIEMHKANGRAIRRATDSAATTLATRGGAAAGGVMSTSATRAGWGRRTIGAATRSSRPRSMKR